MSGLLLAVVGCAGAGADDAGSSALAVSVDDPSARLTQTELVTLVTTGTNRLVEVEQRGDTHICAVLADPSTLESSLDVSPEDVAKVLVFRGRTFVLSDTKTGASATLGGSELASDLDAIVGDLGEPVASAIAPRTLPVQQLLGAAVKGLAALARKEMTQTIESKGTAVAAKTETAEAVREATSGVAKWTSARVRSNTVGTAFEVPEVDWTRVADKATALGVKTTYLGKDGANAYLTAVAGDRTLMTMTHSGKLSEKRLVEFPVLRGYLDRGTAAMPRVLALFAKQETRTLRVLGGGTLEGGQIPVYRGVESLQGDGVDIVVDSVMAGPGAAYILADKAARSEHLVIQGLEWGGESATATSAAKMGLLWGGGQQAKDEALRLLQAGRPVWAVRERAALASVPGMPNAAGEIEAAAQALVASGALPRERLSLLHVYETWPELEAALAP